MWSAVQIRLKATMLTKARLSIARKILQRYDVCCAKGRDIGSAQFTDIGQSSAAPTGTLTAKAFDQKISCQANGRYDSFRVVATAASDLVIAGIERAWKR
jgi:hypothetical protein